MQIPSYNETDTAWCEFTAPTVIGLFFFEKMRDSCSETVIVTVEMCANMLQNRIITNPIEKQLRESMNFMQDCALPHFAQVV